MSQTGVIMFHGTLGSPLEYASLAETLQVEGYRTHCISLPGHGPRPRKSLGKITSTEILDHCREEYQRFAGDCDNVILIGHSLGAMCALTLAGGRPEKLAGVISFAAAYEHAHFVNYPVGLVRLPLSHTGIALRFMPQGYTGLDHPVFMPWWFPHLYREANQLFRHLRTVVPDITVPVLLAHSPYDMIVPYGEMEKLAWSMGRPDSVRCHTLAECGHQIFPVSGEHEQATAMILDFIQTHRESAQPLVEQL
jgi:pimeloyl-ACP methyl ester carboxylesterase